MLRSLSRRWIEPSSQSAAAPVCHGSDRDNATASSLNHEMQSSSIRVFSAQPWSASEPLIRLHAYSPRGDFAHSATPLAAESRMSRSTFFISLRCIILSDLYDRRRTQRSRHSLVCPTCKAMYSLFFVSHSDHIISTPLTFFHKFSVTQNASLSSMANYISTV